MRTKAVYFILTIKSLDLSLFEEIYEFIYSSWWENTA
jgi:hypothetical protein